MDWRVTAAYSATGIPAAALGAKTLLTLPPGVIELVLGIIFIAKRLVLKLDGEKFKLLMDGLLLVAGVTMLWAGMR